MSDFETEIYVNEGVLMEIHRGVHCTVVQQFGEDWNGPVCSKLHAAAFEELRAGPSQPGLALTADEIVQRAAARRQKFENRAAVILGSLAGLAVGFLFWWFS